MLDKESVCGEDGGDRGKREKTQKQSSGLRCAIVVVSIRLLLTLLLPFAKCAVDDNATVPSLLRSPCTFESTPRLLSSPDHSSSSAKRTTEPPADGEVDKWGAARGRELEVLPRSRL